MEIKKVGIMGFGILGRALYNYMEKNFSLDLIPYDPPLKMGSDKEINEADVVFICVPTPYNENTVIKKGVTPSGNKVIKEFGFDLSYVEAALNVLKEGKVVVIKSTILPGTTDSLQKRYPQHKLMYNPEFLTEASAGHDMVNPTRQILGMSESLQEDFNANEETRTLINNIYQLLPKASFTFSVYVTAKVAEMVKYTGNAWYATKVTFMNQIYDLCQEMDVHYNSVKKCIAAEPMFGSSHLDIFHDGFRGYGGKCLPKDTKSLIQLGAELGVDMTLLKVVDMINEDLKKGNKKKKNK